ncbi:MAG: site-specific integrase [Kiritimatiellae bacterium]|nr:site-specific integrase [Kiritimatiellia bacterium]
MALELRRGRNGKLRRHWYGRLVVNGGAKVVNLGVTVRGSPPATLRDVGDAKFEVSRKEAEKELERFRAEAEQKGHAEHLTERLIELKTGRAVEHVRIDELTARWLALPRAGVLSKAYESGVKSACEQFRTFMAEHHPRAERLYEVTEADAGAFAERLRKTCAPGTTKAYYGTVRGAFKRFLPAGHMNPFAQSVGRTTGDRDAGSVHRVPFTPEELQAVFETARRFEGGVLYGPVVTAACTALRRGDACRLEWKSVDFKEGAVTVRTAKTGETVDLPLLAPLREALEALPGARTGYCFPEAAKMLFENPDGLTWRFKAIIAEALGGSKAEDEPGRKLKALAAAGMAAIGKLAEGSRREHIEEAFVRYLKGESVRKIAAAMGASKGSVSGWLAVVSGMAGKRVIRGKKMSVRAEIVRHTQVARTQGHRAASVRDWHALRTTFVTLALSAGVPMELVRKVTGHRTVEIVMANYFRPGREILRSALAGALPSVLTGKKEENDEGQRAVEADELVSLAGKVAAGLASDVERARLRQLAAAV